MDEEKGCSRIRLLPALPNVGHPGGIWTLGEVHQAAHYSIPHFMNWGNVHWKCKMTTFHSCAFSTKLTQLSPGVGSKPGLPLSSGRFAGRCGDGGRWTGLLADFIRSGGGLPFGPASPVWKEGRRKHGMGGNGQHFFINWLLNQYPRNYYLISLWLLSCLSTNMHPMLLTYIND